jgi:hypothetical protein
MNLQPVTGTPFRITCKECGVNYWAGDIQTGSPTTIYADLNGRAWKDYYCAMCAGDVRAAQHATKHRLDFVNNRGE